MLGKIVVVDVSVTGTSNATTLTLTLPVAAKYDTYHVTQNRNNGVSAAAVNTTTASSTTYTSFAAVDGSAFTASGQKWTRSYGIKYEANS